MSVTNNINNTYTVEIVIDSNNPSSPPSYTASGVPYYKVAITPKNVSITSPHSGYDMVPYVGNFKIDGETGRFTWLWNFNQTSTCLPPPTPHGINSSFNRLHSYQGAPGNCVGSFSNSRLSVQGPIKFNNDTYAQGNFLTDSAYATWSHIHLVEVYEDLSGNLVNANMENPSTGLLATNSDNWQVWDGVTPAPSSIYRFGKPVRIDAYVYVVYDPNISPVNQVINIDFDCADSIVGCMDSSAINGSYNPNATVSDPTICQYPAPVYSIQFSDNDINATGDYVGTYQALVDAGYVNTKGNYLFNAGPSYLGFLQSQPFMLANTYAAGDIVNEIVQIDLIPKEHPSFNNADDELVFDFPYPNVGPDGNIPQTPGYFQDPTNWGDAKNNLTGASFRLLNLNDQTRLYDNVAGDSQWCNQADPTGSQPAVITRLGTNPGPGAPYTSHITTTDPNGDPLSIPLGYDPLIDPNNGGVGIAELYYSNSDPQLNDNPGYEWFPYKLILAIEIRGFVMPAHDVTIGLDIDHNTENQGDVSWTTPI